MSLVQYCPESAAFSINFGNGVFKEINAHKGDDIMRVTK